MASSSPTSSSTLATATSSSTSSGTGGGGSIFSGRSATPLIVAFLAIGLLTTVAIGALGWRRAYLARNGLRGLPLGHPPSAYGEFIGRDRRYRVNFLQKPKLWDIWTVGGEGGVEERTGASFDDSICLEKYPVDETRRNVTWQDIMPIAACPLDCRRKGSKQNANDAYGPEDTAWMFRLGIYSRHLVKKMKQLVQQDSLPAEADIAGATGGAGARRKETSPPRIIEIDDLNRYESLHVAVAIAMPKPKRSGSDSEVMEYSVGICRIPCNEVEGPKRHS